MRSKDWKRSRFSEGLFRPAFLRASVVKLFGILILAFSLSACSYVRSAVDYAQGAASQMYAKASQALTEEPNDNNQVLTDVTGATPALAAEADEAAEQVSEKKPEKPMPMVNVVLRSAPRHLMVKPRTDPVWLWDRPGGTSGRAVRIKKVPSGTPGKVVEFEPEPGSASLWAEMNLKNTARQPVRWVKVATLLGVGWVRTEFVEPQ